MHQYLLLGCMLVSGIALSQRPVSYANTDRWVASFTPTSHSIPELTTELLENTANDFVQIRRIFQFLTVNISYDLDAYRLGNKRINRSSRDILERRKAVCWGFSQLLREMCLEAEIPAYTVVGYCKPLQVEEPDFSKPDHAWNAVQLEGEYYLIDVTWATSLPGQREAFFLADPKHFVQSHYPAWKAFQLLRCPIDLGHFMEGDEVAENDCTYEYADSLALYSKMPYLDQRLYEQRVARIENPTEENRSQYGHALFDQAIIIKERADSLLEMDQWLSSVELYESALQTFKAGNDYAEAYPWQAEAFGFAYFNYSMALYQAEQGKDQKGIKNIRLALSEARRILNGMEEKSIFVEQALEMIEQNLEVLK